MQLGKGEHVIRSYDYSETTAGARNSLTLTNRRIITVHTDHLGDERTEIRVQDVTSIDSSYKKKKKVNILGLIFLLAGLALLLVYFIAIRPGDDGAKGIKLNAQSGIFIIGGAVLAVLGIFLIAKFPRVFQSFYLVLTTKITDGRILTLSAAKGMSVNIGHKKGFFRRLFEAIFKSNRKVQIRIDETAARGIVEDIGAIVYELQDKMREDASSSKEN